MVFESPLGILAMERWNTLQYWFVIELPYVLTNARRIKSRMMWNTRWRKTLNILRCMYKICSGLKAPSKLVSGLTNVRLSFFRTRETQSETWLLFSKQIYDWTSNNWFWLVKYEISLATGSVSSNFSLEPRYLQQWNSNKTMLFYHGRFLDWAFGFGLF